jgi:UDP-glucose 4-epimerase
VVHSLDAAAAFRQAVVRDVRGAFNLAADPPIGARELARLLGARTVRLPLPVVRGAVATTWQLRMHPAAPQLFDAMLRLPIMSTARARTELDWQPRHSATDTLAEFLAGLRDGAGMDTPPLAPATSGPLRVREVTSSVTGRP